MERKTRQNAENKSGNRGYRILLHIGMSLLHPYSLKSSISIFCNLNAIFFYIHHFGLTKKGKNLID